MVHIKGTNGRILCFLILLLIFDKQNHSTPDIYKKKEEKE
jgi:hypothetical protein